MFFDVSYRFFCAEFKSDECQLKSFRILVDSRSKVNLKVKFDFKRNEARNKCNISFPCHFDWAILFGNYFDYSM